MTLEVLTLEELAGEDPRMLRYARNGRRIADSNVSLLIQGPTGSGKEAFAHAIHLASRRSSRPFVAVNCAAIPETLIESELFGYRPGAFTGANREGMRGKIAQSSGGTLFLDEIGDMPLSLQSRLLRVLEAREVVPLGSERAVPVELHVISASQWSLRELIARGAFREDLYYRLNGITIELPALRERADKENLIRRVLAAEAGHDRPAAIELEALGLLLAYAWPGNIRELRNVIRTAIVLCEGGVVRTLDLPREIREPDAAGAAPPGAVPAALRDQIAAIGGGAPLASIAPLGAVASLGSGAPIGAIAPVGTVAPIASRGSPAGNGAEPPGALVNPLQAAERSALLRVLEECRGNMTRVASQLGMSRSTLYRRMRRHAIPLRWGAVATFERYAGSGYEAQR